MGATGAVIAAAVAAAVAQVAQVVKSIQPVVVTNAPKVEIVDNSQVKTVEGQRAFGRYVVGEVTRALDQNDAGLESRFNRLVDRRRAGM
jgi:hypothetical protein